MTKHHTIITGTGRAGTTFLVQLLTVLGLDTGFDRPDADLFPNCNAGLEWGLTHPDAPYIVKDPRLCDTLQEILESHNIQIDRVILPIRDLYAAAESRRDVERRTPDIFIGPKPGGLIDTEFPDLQEVVLAGKLYQIIYTVALYNIPLTLLHFPRSVQDPPYLYSQLSEVLGEIQYDRFLEAFQAIARPELVHF